MRTVAHCCWWRSLGSLNERLTSRVQHASRRVLSTLSSSSSPSPSPAPSSRLFENPAAQDYNYTSFPDGVLTSQSIAWAESVIDDLEKPRGKTSAFYDVPNAACTLCDARLQGGYPSHQTVRDHATRLAIVSRVLALLYTFYSQATLRTSSNTASSSSRRGRHSGSASHFSRSASRLHGAAAAQSCYYTPYSRSPLFDEDGVPSAELLAHRSQTLRELDSVDVLLKRWWRNLNSVPASKGGFAFDRILSLSSDDAAARLHRLRYLIFFLTSRGVLRESVTITGRDDGVVGSAGLSKVRRHATFERLEIVGDAAFKNIALDRMRALFPGDEGGVASSMRDITRILDSNHGLLGIYDYLQLDDVLSVSLANNKSKSDVVEALVGELHMLLCSAEVTYNTDTYGVPGDRATALYLRAVVAHTLSELGHVTLMWRIDSTVRNAKDLIAAALEKEFGEQRRSKRHRADSAASMAQEAEWMAKSPRNAPQPLLLPWERPHPGLDTVADVAAFALERHPARPRGTFQSRYQHLSPTPCAQPQELRRCLAVQWYRSAALTPQRAAADVARSFGEAKDTPAAPSMGEMAFVDSPTPSTSPERHDGELAVPALQQQPSLRTSLALPRPSGAAMRELQRANCVVVQLSQPCRVRKW